MNFVLFLFVIAPYFLFAQQNVRGVVLERGTQEPIIGATVIVTSGDQQFGATTNLQGEFLIPDIPVGRCNIVVSMIGFRPHAASNILVYAGRETILEILLEEDLNMLDELVVTPQIDRTQPLNQVAMVSARMLSVEEAQRFAGTFGGDVARMTTGFAGVVSADDTRNDIIIRGNSPRGVLWRLDGFDIPNPNHFGAMSGTGGPIGMINTNLLANSDFLTGTFPAEFGNATSGVFDLRLRNGNNRNHEFLGSIGMNGFEFGAEGPLSRETGASYIVNVRYSFLRPVIAAMEALGGSLYGVVMGLPEYEDITAKINIPLRNGNLSWVLLGGLSRIQTEHGFDHNEEWIEGDRRTNENIRNTQIFTGLNYTHRFSPTTRLENRLSYQFFRQRVNIDEVAYPGLEVTPNTGDIQMQEGRVAFMSTLHHRFDARNTIRGGVGADLYMTNLYVRVHDRNWVDFGGNTGLLRAFAQWHHRFSNEFSLTSGVYSQLFTLNNDFSVEPRIGLRYQLTPRSALSFGTGLHSQIQPQEVYLFQDENGVQPNRDLGMNRSWQSAVGFQQRLGERMRLKVEVYYQHLFNIPVTPETPEESILNMGDQMFNSAWFTPFVNEGTGRNYGVEVTLERFFDNNYYFLITASLFDSKYTGFDGIERRTRFASNFALNALAGYEWRLGDRRLLSANTRLSWVGGKRYVPGVVDTTGDPFDWWVGDFSRAYENRLPNFFRLDFSVQMRQNFSRTSIEYFVELNNVTNHRNILTQFFDVNRGRMRNFYQYGFMPVGGVRFHF